MRFFVHILLACGTIAGITANASNLDELSKENHHVYLLIGQSNMAGRAPIPGDQSARIDRCYVLNDKDEWEPATNPLNRYSTIRKDISMQKLNPGYGFSLGMLEHYKDITIGLVVNARGGTRIEQWEKGTEYYNEAIRRVKIAQKSGTLMGILWHQGESNSGNPQDYQGKLEKLVADMRKDIGIADLPFVVGQVFYDPETKPHTQEINAVLARAPSLIAFTGCVSSEELSTLDNSHFDTPGMLLLGRRYAGAMIELHNKTEQPMIKNSLLRALELDKAGDWEGAHSIAQDIHTADGSWLHAYLHRKEGDLGNAAYWYSRAGKPVADDTLDEEWDRLYAAFKDD